MQPTDFPEKTNLLPIHKHFPKSMPALPAFNGNQIEMGYHVFVTKWMPNEQEKKDIAAGKGFYIKLYSEIQPPMEVFTENPFPPDKKRKYFFVIQLVEDKENPDQLMMEPISGLARENNFITDHYFTESEIQGLVKIFHTATEKPSIEGLQPLDAFGVATKFRTEIIHEFLNHQHAKAN